MISTLLHFALSLDMECMEKIPEQVVNVLLGAFCLASMLLETPRFTSLGIFLSNWISTIFSGDSESASELQSPLEKATVTVTANDSPLDSTTASFETSTQHGIERGILGAENGEEMEREVETHAATSARLATAPTTKVAPPPEQAPKPVPGKLKSTAVKSTSGKSMGEKSSTPVGRALEPEIVEVQVETTQVEVRNRETSGSSGKNNMGIKTVTSGDSPGTGMSSQAIPSSSKSKSHANVNVNVNVSSNVNANVNAKANVKSVPPSFRATVHKVFPYPSLSGYERALRYLEAGCSPTVGFQSRISSHRDLSDSVEIKTEIFTSALIFDLIVHLPGISSEIPEILLSFISKHTGVGVFNKFVDRSVADDVDTTSVCLWSLLSASPSPRIELNSAKAIAKILTLNNNEGNGGRVIQAMIPPFPKGVYRAEIDVAALANVMRVLYFLEMEAGAKETEDYVFRWLHNSDNFTRGTPFYHSSDVVLYFLSNSLSISKKMKTRFSKVMMVRLLSNLGKSEYPLDLALRIMTAYNLGLYTDDENFSQEQSKFQDKAKFDILRMEIMKLRKLQLDDGSWPLDAVYRYDSFYLGSKAAITAFATKALYMSRNISNF